jgi:alpha-2-macroglobulin
MFLSTRAALLFAALAFGPAAHALRVESASPSGEVAEVRQVVVRFDAAAVRAGDPRAAAPFTLQCNGQAPAGSARWLDDRRWGFDLRAPLGAGQRCVLQPVSGFKAVDGSALVATGELSFSTGAPRVLSVQPYPGLPIEEEQHFLLELNGAVDGMSVQRHAWCEVEGLGERIAVKLVQGPARDAVVQQLRGGLRGRARSNPAHHLLLACERPFAAQAKVRLVWGAGIASAERAALVTRGEQRWQWTVRARFQAEFSCEREKANAPCLPLRPLTLRFNAPVPRALALAARLTPQAPAGAPPIGPQTDAEERGALVQEVRFAAPLLENTRFTLSLPADLRDDSGRALANAASFPLTVATGSLPPLAKFAGAPFGIVEAPLDAQEPALLPITLRQVQADIAGASTGGQVRVRRIGPEVDDKTLLEWIARLERHHERVLSAREAGLPQKDWYAMVPMPDALGRLKPVRQERSIETRTLSLLAADAQAQRTPLPQPAAGSDARATEVLGLPLAGRGYHVVEVESRILGHALLAERAPMYVRTGALVTNLAVHFKRGLSSSLVWVSTLDRARPVAGARVAVSDCRGRQLWSGSTDASGIARIERGFDERDNEGTCLVDDGHFVSARVAGDLAFVFSRWSRGIEPWRFNLPQAGRADEQASTVAHTVFDRMLLRVGETVSMKHFVRDEVARGLAPPAAERLPTEVLITHVGSGHEVVLPLEWPRGSSRAPSAAESRWRVPKTAALGQYEVALRRGQRVQPSGSFRVEAFRVPLVDAQLVPPKGVQVAPQTLAFGAQLRALAGGPMPGAALQLSALMRPLPPQFAGFEEFSFEPPGRREQPESDDAAESDGARVVARNLEARTDAQGNASLALPRLPPLTGPAELTAELSFDDPNGERQTVAQRLRLWPAAVVVGLRLPAWTATRGDARFTVLVLDTDGKPLNGRAVQVTAKLHQVLSTRKRLVGGFYAYDNQRTSRELGPQCSGKTDAQGRLNCDVQLAVSGEVELIAEAKDDAGRASQAAASLWVSSEERWWFAQDNDDRIDILPAKRELAPGETARLQVRMPFREATALVTIEREGVIDARVLTLSGREPVIELPIPDARTTAGAASWAPNVHVAVFVQRGRLREAPWWSLFTWGWRDPADWWRAFRHEGRDYRAPTAMVDLAKPAFKFGVAPLTIGLAEHRLQVQVQPEKAEYRVRETVRTTVRVTQGGKPVANAEVAFAAVDEGLLALAPNRSWQVLEGLWRPRPWGVETSTAVSEVIGRRHYGRKALPPGGGGGRNPTRELFDTLLLWRGTVALDAKGEAVIEVPLNDSLTSFRLVAIADDAGGRFGTGSASVRVSQDLQLLPGLAPLVRGGDRIDAGFTLRNSTTRAMNVQATLAGTADGEGGRKLTFAPQAVQLAPGAAAELRWTVEVPPGSTRIEWEAAAAEAGTTAAAASDRLKLTQAVAPVVPQRVWQSSLVALDKPLSMAIALPADSLPGQGAVRVSVQPSLATALPGLRRFFETYPYTCLEQKTSRAIALGDTAGFDTLRNELPGYLDSDGLAHYFPPAPGSAPGGSDRLTAYLLSTAHEAGLAWPQASREAMLAGLAAFVEGRLVRRFPSPRADLEMRKLSALDALARHGRAEPRMLGSINLSPAAMGAWPTSALLDAWSVFERMGNAPDRAARLADIQRLLRGRLVEGGTTLRFSTESEDGWWWLMESADGNAARLLLAATASPAWKDDLPRILNGSLARQQRGAWGTTTANLWGVLALQRFARDLEREPVAGRSSFVLASTPERSIDWRTSPQGDALTLPAQAGTLQARHEGSGRPWLTVQTLAAVPLKAPLEAGYRLTRTLSAVERKRPDAWSRGDVLRVRLEVEAQADMAWVVLSDPVPAGAAILGTGLARDSAIATRGERREGASWPAYEERAADAFRSYHAWLPRGRHVVEYTLRLNSSGRFGLPPARVEAMYAPDSFAELPIGALEVLP